VAASTVRHRVPFYETDAMGVVHHSNYVRYLEIARITWLDEHDQPYGKYIEMGRHFATTRVEVEYKRALRFDETVEVAVWLDWVRNASLRLRYALHCAGTLVATAATEHASVDMDGRARRIPRERRDAFAAIAARAAPRP
jgi:acyl-CoA thioester hydrolase